LTKELGTSFNRGVLVVGLPLFILIFLGMGIFYLWPRVRVASNLSADMICDPANDGRCLELHGRDFWAEGLPCPSDGKDMRRLLFFRQAGAPDMGILRISLLLDFRFDLVRRNRMAPANSCAPQELVFMRSGWGKTIESAQSVLLRGFLSVTADECTLCVDGIGEGNK
jgi:hypothetical protein